jgi:hypothetical protein
MGGMTTTTPATFRIMTIASGVAVLGEVAVLVDSPGALAVAVLVALLVLFGYSAMRWRGSAARR